MLVGNSVGKRALGRRKRRRENIKMNFKGTGWEGVEWINLAEEDKWRGLQNMVMDIRVRSVLPSALRSLPQTAPPLPTAVSA
jgi:hypothetical protein